jgi:hypothetical protein
MAWILFLSWNVSSSQSYPKIFEISPHPSPLPGGERVGVRGQNVRREFSDFNI